MSRGTLMRNALTQMINPATRGLHGDSMMVVITGKFLPKPSIFFVAQATQQTKLSISTRFNSNNKHVKLLARMG